MTNSLTLNIKKTKLMLFGTNQSLCKFKDISLIYEGVMIKRVEKFKYLGVLFVHNCLGMIMLIIYLQIYLNVLGLFLEWNIIFQARL